jgi:hypothetical protein
MATSDGSPLEQLSRLYGRAQKDLRQARKADRAIDLLILLLSVITAGALWSLVSNSAPAVSSWIGAICASVVSLLSGVQNTIGPKKKLEQLQPKFQSLAVALGRFRDGRPAGWSDFKHYLAEMESLGVQVPLGPPKKTPEELAAMSASERLQYQQEIEQAVPQ